MVTTPSPIHTREYQGMARSGLTAYRFLTFGISNHKPPALACENCWGYGLEGRSRQEHTQIFSFTLSVLSTFWVRFLLSCDNDLLLFGSGFAG
jgi:hypothetical protein